jgi:hypothetical protein
MATEMKREHWTLSGTGNVVDADGYVVVWVARPKGAAAAAKRVARARLIAAAPELLSMLRRITDSHARLERDRGSKVGTVTESARAAIAKATGAH